MLVKQTPAGCPSRVGETLAKAQAAQVQVEVWVALMAEKLEVCLQLWPETTFPTLPPTLWASPGGICLPVQYLKNYFLLIL
jgi:hypothetical protein